MLGSIVNCVKTASVLFTLSLVLSACGGATGGLPDAQALKSGTSTPTSIDSGTSANQDDLNSNISLSASSVRSTAQNFSSNPSTVLSGTIDRSPIAPRSSSAQSSSLNTRLSGSINRSAAANLSSTARSSSSSSAASHLIKNVDSIKASSVGVSSSQAISSLMNSSKSSSNVMSSSKSTSSKASSSKASSSKASSSKASSSAVNSSKSSSSAASSSKASSSALSSRMSSSSIGSSSKASSSAVSSKVNNAANNSNLVGLGATIQWSHPTERENGTYLTIDEIGGYQIRYKALNDTVYSYISIKGNGITQYNFPLSITGLQFEIAVYDKQGLYSEFVPILAN